MANQSIDEFRIRLATVVRAMTDSTPEDIERQLAAIRSMLKRNVRDFVSEARELADWRCHFRAHPWLYCGGAAALGFILAPRLRSPAKVSAAVAGDEAAEQFVVQPAAVGSSAGGLLEVALKFAATALVREAFGYLAQRARRQAATARPGTRVSE